MHLSLVVGSFLVASAIAANKNSQSSDDLDPNSKDKAIVYSCSSEYGQTNNFDPIKPREEHNKGESYKVLAPKVVTRTTKSLQNQPRSQAISSKVTSEKSGLSVNILDHHNRYSRSEKELSQPPTIQEKHPSNNKNGESRPKKPQTKAMVFHEATNSQNDTSLSNKVENEQVDKKENPQRKKGYLHDNGDRWDTLPIKPYEVRPPTTGERTVAIIVFSVLGGALAYVVAPIVSPWITGLGTYVSSFVRGSELPTSPTIQQPLPTIQQPPSMIPKQPICNVPSPKTIMCQSPHLDQPACEISPVLENLCNPPQLPSQPTCDLLMAPTCEMTPDWSTINSYPSISVQAEACIPVIKNQHEMCSTSGNIGSSVCRTYQKCYNLWTGSKN